MTADTDAYVTDPSRAAAAQDYLRLMADGYALSSAEQGEAARWAVDEVDRLRAGNAALREAGEALATAARPGHCSQRTAGNLPRLGHKERCARPECEVCAWDEAEAYTAPSEVRDA